MTIKPENAGAFEDVLREIEEHDAQVKIERDGKTVAILVSPRYLQAFNDFTEALEDQIDLDAHNETMSAIAAGTEQTLSLDEFRTRLGL